MRIEKLELKNFRGVDNFVLEPKEKITTILGPIGSGKTSILRALELALTNQSKRDVTLIKNGTSNMNVDVSLDKMHITTTQEIKSTKNPKTGLREPKTQTSFILNGKKTTRKAVDDMLQRLYSIRTDAMLNTLSMETLRSMDSGALTSFLMSYIPEQMDFDKMCSYVPNMNPNVYSLYECHFPPMPETFDIPQVEEIRTQLELKRKEMKKNFNSVSHFLEKENVAPKRKETDIKADLDSVLVSLGGIDAEQKLYSKWEKEQQDIQAYEEKIKILEQQLAQNTTSKPSEVVKDNLNTKKAELEDAMRKKTEFIHLLKRDVEVFQKTLDNLSSNVCPISEKLVCTTDKTVIKEEILDLIQSNQAGIQIQETEVEKLKKDYEEVIKKIEEYNKEQTAYTERLHLVMRLADLKKMKPTVTSKPKVPQDKTILLSVKKELENELKEYQEYIQIQTQKKAAQLLKDNIDIYNEAISLLQYKGKIMDGIQEYYVQYFNHALEERSKIFNVNFSIFLKCENGISLYMKRNGLIRSASDCSTGELALVYFLFADMINQLSGFNIIFFDDIDKLDEDALDDVLTLITSPEVQNQYEHIFLMGIHHKDTVELIKKNHLELISL